MLCMVTPDAGGSKCGDRGRRLRRNCWTPVTRHEGVGDPNWSLRGCRYGCLKFSTEQGIQFTLMPVVGSPSDVESLWCA